MDETGEQNLASANEAFGSNFNNHGDDDGDFPF
jgi:hypothetical protein